MTTQSIIFLILLLLKALKIYFTRLGIDGPVVKATGFQRTQNPYRGSQPSVTSNSGGPNLSPHVLGHQAYLCYTDIQRQNIITHKIRRKKKQRTITTQYSTLEKQMFPEYLKLVLSYRLPAQQDKPVECGNTTLVPSRHQGSARSAHSKCSDFRLSAVLKRTRLLG